jgi:GTPase SAR1 family protein
MNDECLADVVRKRRKVLDKKQGIEEEILRQAESSGDLTKLRGAIEKGGLDDIRATMQHIASYAPQDYVTRVSLQEKASGKVQYKVGDLVAAIKPGIAELNVPSKALYLLSVETSPFTDAESSFNAVWLGMVATGKSSLIERIRQGEFNAAPATIGLNVSSFIFEGMKLVNCDLSGHKSFRTIWDSLIVGRPDIVIYVVDASDSSTTKEAGDVLANYVLKSEHLAKVPLLILYNKQDVDGVPSTDKLNSELRLQALICDRKWKSIQTSAKNGVGIPEALEWILQQIKAETGVNAP